MALPGAEEVAYRGEPWFNVGTKSFALQSGGRIIFKLDKGRQDLLFEIRPDTFAPFHFGPNTWSYVDLATLDEPELTDLLREAWTRVVPKMVSRAVLGATEADRTTKRSDGA